MSRTVSFRASEELDEFLEQEAERRMTTKSTVSQMLLAERVRQIQEERGEDETADAVEDDLPEEEDESPEQQLHPIFEKHADKWYRPDSQQAEFAVYVDDGNNRKYYKSERGAKQRLKEEYGE